MGKTADIAIVGGGILGTSLAYFLAGVNNDKKIVVIEQAFQVAQHTSSRNTGKVHAPYLYNPQKKKLFAKAAFAGFEMWQKYSELKDIPFKKDGVIEVALDEEGCKVLDKYMDWGKQNGLEEQDIELMDKAQLKKIEPEIECEAAIYCYKDGSTDFGKFTKSLMRDSGANEVDFLLNTKVTDIQKKKDDYEIILNETDTLSAKFLINAAGGEGIDIAHKIGIAKDLTDVHFRGEYWKAPSEYNNLTKASVYSVPEYPDYPFLDPHWIVRVDGHCEIGPNAVPVFSPYGYERTENMKEFIPKLLEMIGSGARKTIFDSQFQSLAMGEVMSSMSKSVMINRVRRFLPKIDPHKITEKGIAGIRSSVIDSNGKFVPDVVMKNNSTSFHILNYNSPGATGALPFAVYIINQLHTKGILEYDNENAQCGPWNFREILEKVV